MWKAGHSLLATMIRTSTLGSTPKPGAKLAQGRRRQAPIQHFFPAPHRDPGTTYELRGRRDDALPYAEGGPDRALLRAAECLLKGMPALCWPRSS